jgi:peptide/nickel transport system substrate-binding protein
MTRRELIRWLTVGTGVAAGTALIAACGGSASPATTTTTSAPAPSTRPPTQPSAAQAGGAGQVSLFWPKPVSFNPLFSTTGAEQGVEQLMLGALVKVNDKLEVLPDIAESIDISTDAKAYTFHLKKTLKFTDGQPLTARDVVFTLQRAVDKRTGSYWRGRLGQIEGATDYGDQKADSISGLSTPDDYTLKMMLVAPDATWLQTLGDFAGMGILPAHVLQDVAPDQLKQHPFTLRPNVSAGVFEFGKYETDQYLEITRNENYGGGAKARLDRIFFKILTRDAALAQLEKGELDLMVAPVSEVGRLKRAPNLEVVSVPSPSVSFMTVSLEKPYLGDKRIRQAMMYAIDREGIVKSIYQGEAQVVNQTIIGPDWMDLPQGLNTYAYDPGKAKQLLQDANWDSSRSIEALYVPGDKEQDAFVPIVQQQLQAVGFALQLRQVESAEYNRRRTVEHNFEVAFVGGGIFRQDPNVSGKYFETVNFVPGGANYSHYSNKRVDELFAAGRAITDVNERKKIYSDIAVILNDEVPWIFLWSPNSIFAHTRRLVGFKPPSYATHNMWNADEWTVATS